MYVESVPNRSSPPAILFREAARVDGKVVKRTLANLSDWPPVQVDSLRRLLKGETLGAQADAFRIQRSIPHGRVAAMLGTLRRLGLEPILSRSPCAERDLVVARSGSQQQSILCPSEGRQERQTEFDRQTIPGPAGQRDGRGQRGLAVLRHSAAVVQQVKVMPKRQGQWAGWLVNIGARGSSKAIIDISLKMMLAPGRNA